MTINIELQASLEDIDAAFNNIEFAIRLLTYCENGKISPEEFDKGNIVELTEGNLHFPTGRFTEDNLLTAARINVSAAFAVSAIALDNALDLKGIKSTPITSSNQSQCRALIYMIRCAYAHGIADPRWEARKQFQRHITVSLCGKSISLDLTKLHGQPFDFPQIRGHANWFLLKEAAIQMLTA